MKTEDEIWLDSIQDQELRDRAIYMIEYNQGWKRFCRWFKNWLME